jgi:hypothetical protein
VRASVAEAIVMACAVKDDFVKVNNPLPLFPRNVLLKKSSDISNWKLVLFVYILLQVHADLESRCERRRSNFAAA